VIVPEPGVSVMTAAIRELVRSGDLMSVGIRCESPDEDAREVSGD
jgi:hypothetical protein